MKPPLFVVGMHGLGDNLHQRGIIRQLMEHHDVWLESSWFSVYHDLVASGALYVIGRHVRLRTQSKNANRESHLFSRCVPPAHAPRLQISYPPQIVRDRRSVLGAMCAVAGVPVERADFRLPVPCEWQEKAQSWLNRWKPKKPLMIFRPLVERSEWGGNRTRNPNPAAYAALFDEIRDRFFVLSIADLAPNEEWTVGRALPADVVCHTGELDFETLAALFTRASLVFAPGGFAGVLAQAVGTPLVCVGGGYDRCSVAFAGGSRFARCLFIEPVIPCECFRHDCACGKEIDITAAMSELERFYWREVKCTSAMSSPPTI